MKTERMKVITKWLPALVSVLVVAVVLMPTFGIAGSKLTHDERPSQFGKDTDSASVKSQADGATPEVSVSIAQADDKDPPLVRASREGDLKEVIRLLNQVVDINAKNRDGKTALMSAAEGDNLDVVKLLIEKGADVNARHKYGGTTLTYAALEGNLDVVKLLIDKGLDVNATNECGMTVLMYAALGGKNQNLDVVKFLIDKGADVNAQDCQARTALMYAAWKGNLNVVKLLIEKGAGMNAKEDSPGSGTVLMSLARSFIDKKCSPVEWGKGRTALKIAREKGHKEIVEYLKAHGAQE